MYKLCISVLFISFNVLSYCDNSVIDDTELVLSFLIHRHGDRTPTESSISYIKDQQALIEASAKYGFGQLTDVGKRRGYALGQSIRQRYDSLLSPYYNKSEIYIRSTDVTRTKITVLLATAAIYPALPDNWSEDINWTPTPYTTVPAKYDFLQASLNCPTFTSALRALFLTPASSMAPFKNLLQQWSDIIQLNISAAPALAYLIYDVYTAQMGLGIPLEPELEKIFPEIQQAAGAAINVLYGNDSYLALESGVLLNQFFTVADQVLVGEDVERVHVYSAHDVNVFAFEAITQITPRQGVPKYGAMYALELRKVVKTGEYVVVPVYLASPGEDVVYLQVEGCDEQCSYAKFREITSKYALDENEWRSQCGFTEDLEVDASLLE